MVKFIFMPLFSSLALLFLIRTVVISVIWFLNHFFHISMSFGRKDLGDRICNYILSGVASFFHLLFFVMIFCTIFLAVLSHDISDLEGFLYLLLFGVFGVVWCHFRWDLKFNAFPRLDIDEKSTYVVAKKIFLFIVVFLANIYYYYQQFLKIVYEREVDASVLVFCTVSIPFMMAIDGILNQFLILFRKIRDNNNDKGVSKA